MSIVCRVCAPDCLRIHRHTGYRVENFIYQMRRPEQINGSITFTIGWTGDRTGALTVVYFDVGTNSNACILDFGIYGLPSISVRGLTKRFMG